MSAFGKEVDVTNSHERGSRKINHFVSRKYVIRASKYGEPTYNGDKALRYDHQPISTVCVPEPK